MLFLFFLPSHPHRMEAKMTANTDGPLLKLSPARPPAPSQGICMFCWNLCSHICGRCQKVFYCSDDHLQIDSERHLETECFEQNSVVEHLASALPSIAMMSKAN